MRQTAWRAMLAMVTAALLPRAAAAQCAMCRLALESPEAKHLAAAFRSGILFLLPVPFASFGLVAFMAVRRQRHRQQLRQTST